MQNSLAQLCSLNSQLYLNTLQDIDDKAAQKRLNSQSNSLAFLASHVLDARYYMTTVIGKPVECPFREIFDKAQSIDDLEVFPPLQDLKTAWQEISVVLCTELKNVGQDFANKSPAGFPMVEDNLNGALVFLLQHESYHIGQMALVRKILGYSAMTYHKS
ncbi:DUF664 domain-containing protein [candidate division KSB1 bacterium]|nr:DUF664 domain-containing protein [candidate division KSB1 bacterium]